MQFDQVLARASRKTAGKEAFRNGGTRSQNCWAYGARTFGSVRKDRARANYVIAALVENGCGILPQLQGESFDRNLIVVRWRPKHAKTDGRKILVSGTLSIQLQTQGER